jgi:hypothetical protein
MLHVCMFFAFCSTGITYFCTQFTNLLGISTICKHVLYCKFTNACTVSCKLYAGQKFFYISFMQTSMGALSAHICSGCTIGYASLVLYIHDSFYDNFLDVFFVTIIASSYPFQLQHPILIHT